MVVYTIAEFIAMPPNMGFCIQCEGFTTEGVRPNAEEQVCSKCGEAIVVGSEVAAFLGLIEIVEAE